jgi:hypothetical protein
MRARVLPVGGLQEKGGGQAHRDIHPKHPAPTGVLGEKGAKDGADDGGHAPAPGEDALDGRALLEVVDVRGDGERRGLERPGTEPLHHPEGDELRHRRGEAAEGGAQKENAQSPEKRRPAADAVGQAAGNEDAQGRGEEEGSKNPRIELAPAELRGEGGHGCGDDGGLKCRHHQPEKHRRGRHASGGTGNRHRLGLGRRHWSVHAHRSGNSTSRRPMRKTHLPHNLLAHTA